MNIFIREYKANVKSLIIWTGGVIGFMFIALYEGLMFAGEEGINEMMESFPEGLMAAFALDQFDLSKFEGYFGLMVVYIAILLAVYGVMRSCSIITSEERDKTVEFSLVLPIKRWQLLVPKLLVVLINSVLLNLFVYGETILISKMAELDDAARFVEFVGLSMTAIFFIQLIFIGIGFMLGCIFKQHKKAGGAAVGILLATYAFSILTALHESLDFLKFLTPFKFFNFMEIYNTLKIELTYMFVSAALFAVTVAIGFIGYQRRDMSI